MTAQVAIIDQHGVALAADSAVTVGRDRVWNYANKLFSAGPQNDVGIMIYNSGSYMGVPWEIIIKEYRRVRGGLVFGTIEEFAADFVEFIKPSRFDPDHPRNNVHLQIIIDFLEKFHGSLDYNSKKTFYAQIQSRLADFAGRNVDKDLLPEFMTKIAFTGLYGSQVSAFIKELFKYAPRKSVCKQIIDLVYDYLSHENASDYHTGLVIAGFGKDELFPSVLHFIVDGSYSNCARVWKTNINCVNINGEHTGATIPFAQVDMAVLFMEGIHGSFLNYLSRAMRGFLDEKIEEVIEAYVTKKDDQVVEKASTRKENRARVKLFMDEFKDYRERSFAVPVLMTINALPKEEMAQMAKSIVELTALRRKVASSIESVGGEIEVSIISKGDGFIWINRKHYFDLATNGDFLYRRARQREIGDVEKKK